MSAADEAYRAAERAIARAKAAEAVDLSFGSEEFRALERIPPQIADLNRLRNLNLDNTQVADLSPLADILDLELLYLGNTQITDLTPIAKITGLRALSLTNTDITDLAPLAGMKQMQRLWLNKTRIFDLAPLAGMEGMKTLWLNKTRIADLAALVGKKLRNVNLSNSLVVDLRPVAAMELLPTQNALRKFSDFGLVFDDIPAIRSDRILSKLAKIADYEERTRETLAYLRALPPWPEPYTPSTPDGGPPQTIGGVPDAPDPDHVPRPVLTPDARIDLPPILATEAELADPIRKRLFDRLPAALDALLRYSNRFPELDSPARALRELIEVPFSDADFLLIHLEIDALTDIRESQSARPPADKLDADCLNALASVLRIAPPITMGHPDIDLLEDRGRQYQRSRIPENAAAAEKQIVSGLDKNDLATDRTQEFARRTAAANEGGRVAELRRGFTKNVVLIMYFMTEQVTAAATGHVFGTATVSAAQFLLLHKNAILATAPTWGQSGFAWAQYVMIQAQRIIDEAKAKS